MYFNYKYGLQKKTTTQNTYTRTYFLLKLKALNNRKKACAFLSLSFAFLFQHSKLHIKYHTIYDMLKKLETFSLSLSNCAFFIYINPTFYLDN